MKYLGKLCWCSLAEPPRFAGVPAHFHTGEALGSSLEHRNNFYAVPQQKRSRAMKTTPLHLPSTGLGSTHHPWHFAGSCYDCHSLLAVKMAAVPFPVTFVPRFCLITLPPVSNKDPSPRDHLIAIPMFWKWAKQIRSGGQRPDMPSSTPASYSAPKEISFLLTWLLHPACSESRSRHSCGCLTPLLFAMSFQWETPTPSASTTITSLHTQHDQQQLWAFRVATHTPS